MSDTVVMAFMAFLGGALSSFLIYLATRGNTVASIANDVWKRTRVVMDEQDEKIEEQAIEIEGLKAAAVESEKREDARDVVIDELTAKVRHERSRRIKQVSARDGRIKVLEEKVLAMTVLFEETLVKKDAAITALGDENGRLRAEVKRLKDEDLL